MENDPFFIVLGLISVVGFISFLVFAVYMFVNLAKYIVRKVTKSEDEQKYCPTCGKKRDP